MLRRGALALGGLLGVYLLVNLAAFTHSRILSDIRGDYTAKGVFLVVVAHQDDEMIVAGGAMIKTLAKGGTVHVAYTSDGVTRVAGMTPDTAREKIATREHEALGCLTELGIPEQNCHFLKYENERGLQDPANVMEAIDRIAKFMTELKPYAVATAAFEGGHCDHDMTNFIVAHAAEKAAYPLSQVFEAPSYNRYYLRESIFRKVNRILFFRFSMAPRFLPSSEPHFALDLSPDQLALKKSLFRHFVSYEPGSLKERFGFPDQYRPISRYDYGKGPFEPDSSIRHRLAAWTRSSDANPFLCGFSVEDYRRIYAAMESAWKNRTQESEGTARPQPAASK